MFSIFAGCLEYMTWKPPIRYRIKIRLLNILYKVTKREVLIRYYNGIPLVKTEYLEGDNE